MSATVTLEEAPWKAGLRSARANLIPGLALQAFALAVVLGYYWSEQIHSLLTHITDFRASIGWPFAVLSTSFFGGLLPLLYLKSSRSSRDQLTWKQGALYTAYWAYKGIEISAWYWFLAWAIGDANNIEKVAIKTLLDQFVWCPLWAVPSTAVFYFWCQHGCRLHTVLADLRQPRWYKRRVLPQLCANIGVWLPLVCIIFALPIPLQLPLQNLVLCFYCLLLAHMTRRAQTRPN